MRESSGVKSKLPGIKFISLGGGDSDGRFTKSIVQSITSSINSGAFNGYAGIAYDIEEGDSNLGQVSELILNLVFFHIQNRYLQTLLKQLKLKALKSWLLFRIRHHMELVMGHRLCVASFQILILITYLPNSTVSVLNDVNESFEAYY